MKYFPKIYALDSEYIPNVFEGEVEITEKCDGSYFSFGCDSAGHVVMRSKGKELFFDSYEKTFDKAVEFVIDKQEFLGVYLECISMESISKSQSTTAYVMVEYQKIILYFLVCMKKVLVLRI